MVSVVHNNPAAGIAKAAGIPVLQPDGAYRVDLVFTLRNTGDVHLKNVMVGDDLRRVFAAPVTWTVQSMAASGTLIANTAYNGHSDTSLLQPLSTLDVGRTDSVTVVLLVSPAGSFGPFYNTAVLNAQSVQGNLPVRRLSVAGRDPMAPGSSPTAIHFPPNPKIGLAKSAGETKLEIDGSYTFTYTFFVRNMGNTVLTQVNVADDLQRVFAPPMSFRVVGNIRATGNLVSNAGFNGKDDVQLLNVSESSLPAGREDTIVLTVNVQPNKAFGTYNNTAVVTARAAAAQTDVTDASANGNLADPDANGVPDESSQTPVVLSPTKLRIPQGFSPNGDGQNDRFVIGNVGPDKIQLEVYNRWGNAVYKSADYRNDWNGKSNQGVRFGDDLPDGTYYYIVINLTTGERFMSFITIMR